MSEGHKDAEVHVLHRQQSRLQRSSAASQTLSSQNIHYSCTASPTRCSLAERPHITRRSPEAQVPRMRRSSQLLLPLDGLDLEVRTDEREHQALHVLPQPHQHTPR